jgi:poly-gamma-glutamate capsule biosynthesis protein CapA/YwtB (metallophosphatase superfamily)
VNVWSRPAKQLHLVIPYMHWGWEHEPEACARQRDLARRMIDAEADVVIGGHPHVTQGVEEYRGRLIVYSLWNFVFDGFREPEAREGWVLRLTVSREGLLRWDTVVARIDERGIPRPDQQTVSPSGTRGAPIRGTRVAKR